MTCPDPIERAILDAATRVLARRATALRDKAAGLTSTIPDRDGRDVPVVDPRACIAIGTAALLDAIAADLETVSQTQTQAKAT